MIEKFPYKFVPPKGIESSNKNYLVDNTVYSYLIYSDVSKDTYISFLKENRKLIGTSTINTDHFDYKIANTYYNDLFKYHRIKFKISGKHHDIKKIIFNINNFQGKPYDLILNQTEAIFKDLCMIIKPIEFEKNKTPMEFIDEMSFLITNQKDSKNPMHIEQASNYFNEFFLKYRDNNRFKYYVKLVMCNFPTKLATTRKIKKNKDLFLFALAV